MPQRLGSRARPCRARGTCRLTAGRATMGTPCTPARPTSASWYSFRSAHDAFSPCALSDLPDGRSFSCPGTDRRARRQHPTTTAVPPTQYDHQQYDTDDKGAPDGTDRSTSPDQELGDAAGGGDVRSP